MIVKLISLLLGLVLLSSCSLDPSPSVNPPPRPAGPSTTTTVSSATSPPSSLPAGSCPEGEAMLSEGQLIRAEQPSADGTRITGITWRSTGRCQVVSITFATEDGAPATTAPDLDTRLLRSEGVLRIDTAARSSVIVDQQVGSGMLDRLFVPVTDDGNRFIDLVLSEPVLARARVLSSPARLEIELQPGGPPVGRPLIADNIVIVQPGSVAQVAPTIDVTGYVAGADISLTMAVSLGSVVVEELPVELSATLGAWSAFDIQVQMGNRPYDNLRIIRPDGTVVAGMPFTP